MSFGTSASDIALLVQLAWRTTQGARAACGEYDELTRETSSLHIVLNRLQLEIASSESSIGRRESYRRELAAIAAGCQDVLTQLDKILVKYNALSEQERSVRRLWKKIRFGSGVVADVAELRSRVTYYTSALSLLLNLVSVGTMGTVEKKMDEAGGDLRDIKAAVNNITAHFLATEHQEGSVLTTYTNDDRDAWRELRRELVKAGFRDSIVRRHMDTILDYVKELGSRGLLDDNTANEAHLPSESIAQDLPELGTTTDVIEMVDSTPILAIPTGEERMVPAEERRGSERSLAMIQNQASDSQPSDPESYLQSFATLDIHTDQLEDGSDSMSQIKASTSAFLVTANSLQEHKSTLSHNPGSAQGDGTAIRKSYRWSNLLKAENLRYYSSTALGPPEKSDLIFLDDMELPNFVADFNVIYRTHQQVRSARRFGVEAQFDLALKIEGVQRRLMCLIGPNRLSKPTRSPLKAEEKKSMMQNGVSILSSLRYPKDTSMIDACDIQGLDFRQVTTLCSMFIVDFIRTNNDPVTAPSVDDIIKAIHLWGLRFSNSCPERWDQILEYYGPKLGYPVPKRYNARRIIGMSSLAGVSNTPPIEKKGQWYPHPDMRVGDRPYPWIIATVHEYPPWQPPPSLSALRYWNNNAHAFKNYLEPLLGFIGALANAGETPDTIVQCLNVVINSHADFNKAGSWLGAFEDPRICHAVMEVSDTHIQNRETITGDEVSELIKTLGDSQGHIVLRSFICLAFAGSFRMSDLLLPSQRMNNSIFQDPPETPVNRSSVTILDTHFDITLLASWTPSQHTVYKYRGYSTSDDICPVSAMRAVLGIPGSDETRLFRLSSGDGLTADVVQDFLQGRLEALGHDAACSHDGLCNISNPIEVIMQQWRMDLHARFLGTDSDCFFGNRISSDRSSRKSKSGASYLDPGE